jgi:hypothetical protein
MNAPASRQSQTAGMPGMLGLMLVRFFVPLWVMAGATTKLVEQSPKLLPEHLRGLLDAANIDLYFALSCFIAIEFAAAAVMVLLPKIAKPTALFMLGVFCLVLLHEIFMGNVTNCGCLGGFSPPPWLMLSIDLTLLVLVVALPVRPLKLASDRAGAAAATLIAIALGIVVFMRIGSASSGLTVVIAPSDTTDTTQATEPSTTLQLPGYYSLDTTDWPGQRVRDIDLLSWIPNLPESVNTGEQYIILYSRTCEHCHDLLIEHFSFDPPAPTTLVAVPEFKTGFAEDGQLENPCLDCHELEMPVGVDWLLTPPVVIALKDGVVQCAQEAEDAMMPACLPWHGF